MLLQCFILLPNEEVPENLFLSVLPKTIFSVAELDNVFF